MSALYVPDVLVAGRDICKDFGLIYTDESELGAPEIVTRYVSVPGMDGSLDCTDLLTGEPQFGDRLDTMVFFVEESRSFQKVKTQLSNFLNGRRYEYVYGFDAPYVYEGRFRVTDYGGFRDRMITIEVDASPWKRSTHHIISKECAGGADVILPNGRRPVCPQITVSRPTVISYFGDAWEIPEAGVWEIYDLRLKEGTTTIRVNSDPYGGSATIQDLQNKFRILGNVPDDMRLEELAWIKGTKPSGAQYRVTFDYYEYDL